MDIEQMIEAAERRVDGIKKAQEQLERANARENRNIGFLDDLKLLQDFGKNFQKPAEAGTASKVKLNAGSVVGILRSLQNSIAHDGLEVPVDGDAKVTISAQSAEKLLKPEAAKAWLEISAQLNSGYWGKPNEIRAEEAAARIEATFRPCMEYAETFSKPASSAATRQSLHTEIRRTAVSPTVGGEELDEHASRFAAPV